MTNKLTETKMMAIEINSNFRNNIENNPSTKIFATILPAFRESFSSSKDSKKASNPIYYRPKLFMPKNKQERKNYVLKSEWVNFQAT